MEKFEKLGLSKNILEVLKEEGFESPTEIQEKAIPFILEGKDVVGGSATGSGKTIAFSSSIIEKLKPNGRVQALILTPTRELAEQVADSIRKFSGKKDLNVLAIYGGVNMESQIRRIHSTDVVVGTPGRILDHLNRRTLKFDQVKFLVLDEVDRMLDMGFIRDVEKIISTCPKERQTMLFSATISADVDHLAKRYTKNPVKISVKSYLDSSKLKQTYYDVDSKDKFSLLVHLLKEEGADLIMIFCSTRRNVDFVADNLNGAGIDAQAIHGGLDQNKRLRVLKEFHGKGIRVLVCTDVAARGLDIKGVSHVYNYDLPPTSSEYIHRIGRTARAENEGKAISLLSNRDYENFGSITRDKFLKIDREELPRFESVRTTKTEFKRNNFSRGGGGFNSGGRGTATPRGRDAGRNFGGQSRSFSGTFRGGGDHGGRRENNSSRGRTATSYGRRDVGRRPSRGRR